MGLSLKYFPDNILNIKCVDVVEFDEELKNQIKEMKKLVGLHKGYALAAPQVGILKRFFIVANNNKLPKIDVVINPVIEDPIGETRFKESCLSIPGVEAWNKRIKSFRLSYQDEFGYYKILSVSGLFSIVCQHEIDHLDGKLFIDSLDFFEKSKITGKINKLRK